MGALRADTDGMRLWLPGLLLLLVALALLVTATNVFLGILYGSLIAVGGAFCATGAMLSVLGRARRKRDVAPPVISPGAVL
jgi:hypothetical protein